MRTPTPRHHIRLLFIGFEGGLIVLAVVLGWLLGRPTVGLIHPTWRGLVWGVTAALPLLPVLWWCVHSNWGPMRRLRTEVDARVVPMFAHMSLLDMAVASLLAGVGEELLFRGLIQGGLADLAGIGTALIATSVLFGALHWVTNTYAVLATAAGGYLGALFVLSGDLVAPIVTHAVYDMVALVYLRRRGRPHLTRSQSSG